MIRDLIQSKSVNGGVIGYFCCIKTVARSDSY